MMLQVTAVALLSEAKIWAHPASVDNVPTDGGKEVHVSMGMTAATKLRSIVDNAEAATAIELITAAEALEYRKPLAPGRGVQAAYDLVRAHVPPLLADRSMSEEIQRVAQAIRNGVFDSIS
jgi:histidine ammonia-lyase